MESSLILIANPGSASRKYALYAGDTLLAELHFEWQNGQLVCGLKIDDSVTAESVEIDELDDALDYAVRILRKHNILESADQISAVGLRVVAPGSYFLEHHLIDANFEKRLETARILAPIHVSSSLDELRMLREQFPETRVFGVSDSAFHATRPNYSKYYGVPKADADKFDIKRFGYHGLSVASVVRALDKIDKLPPKLVVAHLGSGASVSAVLNARSVDNTMGFSPLEGLTMSTRAGSIDQTTAAALKIALGLDDNGLSEYLNQKSGLLGLGGSSEIPELLKREKTGDAQSRLALNVYLFNVQKAIGQMSAVLGGIDALVFTGTVGERADLIRHHIVSQLHYLDFHLDQETNKNCQQAVKPTVISKLAHSKPVFVVPANESYEMLQCVKALLTAAGSI